MQFRQARLSVHLYDVCPSVSKRFVRYVSVNPTHSNANEQNRCTPMHAKFLIKESYEHPRTSRFMIDDESTDFIKC